MAVPRSPCSTAASTTTPGELLSWCLWRLCQTVEVYVCYGVVFDRSTGVNGIPPASDLSLFQSCYNVLAACGVV